MIRTRYMSSGKFFQKCAIVKHTNPNTYNFNKGFVYSRSSEDPKLWSITDRFGKELFPKRKGVIVNK